MIEKKEKILITGSSGMVGSALLTVLQQRGYTNILVPLRQELDLEDRASVDAYFSRLHPDYVFMIAAKVGGISANMADPVGFLTTNLQVQLNLFQSCYKYKVKKNLFLGSSCVYPRECPQPMKEEYLMAGPLEPTNEGYALAKIVGLKFAQYYYQQNGMVTVCPMLCNIYGTNDHFEFQRSHVLSALVRRFVDACDEKKTEIMLWGTGVARREFIHVKDVADALLFLMEHVDRPDIINVGTGEDVSIRELAELIAREAGYDGRVSWDKSKPDGMLRKCLDVSRLTQMGFSPGIDLLTGVRQTIAEYKYLKGEGRIE